MFAQWPSVSYSAIEKVKWRGRGYSHSERRQRARASLPALCALLTLVKRGDRNNKCALILVIFWKLDNWRRQSQDHAINSFVYREVKFHPCSSTVALLNDYSIDRDSSVRGSWTKQTNNLTVCLLDNNELLIQWSRGCAAFVLPRPDRNVLITISATCKYYEKQQGPREADQLHPTFWVKTFTPIKKW